MHKINMRRLEWVLWVQKNDGPMEELRFKEFDATTGVNNWPRVGYEIMVINELSYQIHVHFEFLDKKVA